MMQPFPKKEIQALIDFVWDNPYSTFYKSLWQERGIATKPMVATAADLARLPFTTREDVARIPDPLMRLHMDLRDVDNLTLTSGTTEGGVLLFWHTIPEHSTRLVPYQKKGPTILMSFNLQHKFLIHAVRARYAGMQALAGDAHDLRRSARVAQAAGVNTLYITPTLALLFADYLLNEECIENITMLVLWGEYCSDASFALLRKRYPEAHFVLEYSSTEADHIAYATDSCSFPNRMKHIDTDAQYMEIVDDEVVLTTLHVPRSNPLIRYRTGDKARFIEEQCLCGSGKPCIELLGRIGGDVIRVAGGEVKIEEIDRVMLPFQPYIESNFYVEISEKNVAETLVVTFVLSIQKRQKAWPDEQVLRERIAIAFMEEFRLSPSLLLKDAIAAGMIAPIAIKFVPVIKAGEKHRRLTRVS